MRVRLPVVAAILAALAGLAGGAAGGFGASLSPVELVWEQEQEVIVSNKSDVGIRASLEVVGDGWTVAEPEFTLAVGEARRVAVTAAGPETAVLRVIIQPAAATRGMDTISIVLEGRMRHQTWLEANDVRPLLLAGLLAVIGAGIVLGRLARSPGIRAARPAGAGPAT